MNRIRKHILCLLCAALLLPMAACGGDTLRSFTWFVEEIPANLDPQIAATSAELIACTHLYSGLFRQNADGSLENDLCESYTVSADGLTYTFTLRPGLTYRKARGGEAEYPVTAADFVFAFRRVFRAETASPYAASFAGIRNSAAVLDGTLDESALGVSAPDDTTLVIQLSAPDVHFPEKLTLPGAMPCNEAFFDSTQGTYGLSSSAMLSCGPFYLYNWTSSGLFLRRAADGHLVNSLRLVQNTDTSGMGPTELVENEKCTAILDSGSGDTGLTELSYSDTTWCLLFNPDTVFADQALRQALSIAAREVSLPDDETLYTAAAGIVPDGAAVDSLDYRDGAGDLAAPAGDGAALYAQALDEVGVENLSGLSILVPESADSAYVQALNGLWQTRYSLFLNVETVPDEEFAARCASGRYTLALAPLTLTRSDPYALLAIFADDAGDCYAGDEYAALLGRAAAAAGRSRLSLLAEAERQLAADCLVTPLYAQQKRLLVDPAVEGLRFEPYGPVLDVTGATME